MRMIRQLVENDELSIIDVGGRDHWFKLSFVTHHHQTINEIIFFFDYGQAVPKTTRIRNESYLRQSVLKASRTPGRQFVAWITQT